jgi:hypothetical protein
MKTKLLCTAILAMTASFSAVAQDAAQDLNDPTVLCLAVLADQPQFALLSNKMALVHTAEAAYRPAPDRFATTEERNAIAQWASARRQCFGMGAKRLSNAADADFRASMFGFHQSLLANLREGRMTFAQFNERRVELAEFAQSDI